MRLLPWPAYVVARRLPRSKLSTAAPRGRNTIARLPRGLSGAISCFLLTIRERLIGLQTLTGLLAIHAATTWMATTVYTFGRLAIHCHDVRYHRAHAKIDARSRRRAVRISCKLRWIAGVVLVLDHILEIDHQSCRWRCLALGKTAVYCDGQDDHCNGIYFSSHFFSSCLRAVRPPKSGCRRSPLGWSGLRSARVVSLCLSAPR